MATANDIANRIERKHKHNLMVHQCLGEVIQEIQNELDKCGSKVKVNLEPVKAEYAFKVNFPDASIVIKSDYYGVTDDKDVLKKKLIEDLSK